MSYELNKVQQVYSGTPGCMCGCNGNYRVASEHALQVAQLRGYDVQPDEISDRSVKIIFNKILKNPQHRYDADAKCIFVNTGTRVLAAYFA